MSQLRLLKPLVFKNVLRHTNVRMFSSTSTYPFMLIDNLINIKEDQEGRVELRSDDQQNLIIIKDSKLRDEVCDAMTTGISRLSRLYISYQSYGICVSERIWISHKPSDPKIADERISLPPLPYDSKIQNIAMSSLPIQDKDWVVGVKFSGSKISLCRPFGNRKWFNVKAMPEVISSFSSLMFSKTDDYFYVPSPGGKHLFGLDHDFEIEKEDLTDITDLLFDKLPNSVVDDLQGHICSRTDHLVESPCGDLFLVKWYGEDLRDNYTELMHNTKQFVVFRAEDTPEYDEKNMIYTEDIGDLCILLGHGEPLCVPASSAPGLRPNCIYFVGYNFGVYDLTTKTCSTFLFDEYERVSSLVRKLEFPYWSLPLPVA